MAKAKKKSKKTKKKKTKKKSTKECLHNILVRQKYGDPWKCGRCGKTMSATEMKKRIPHD